MTLPLFGVSHNYVIMQECLNLYNWNGLQVLTWNFMQRPESRRQLAQTFELRKRGYLSASRPPASI